MGESQVSVTRWAVEWYSKSRLDGVSRFFVWDGGNPCLFRSRADARDFIRQKWGYIAQRPDLRAEPHGWRLPKAVRVFVRLERAK